MRALTIKQPWATLIAKGYKKYEFRSWKTNYRGPLLIHAGKGVDKKAMERFKHLNLEYPKSQIIAVACLDDCIFIDDKINKQILEENKNVYGPNDKSGLYAWALSNVKELNENKTVKGKLGLWHIEL